MDELTNPGIEYWAKRPLHVTSKAEAVVPEWFVIAMARRILRIEEENAELRWMREGLEK